MIAVFGQSIIDGTTLDDVFLAIVAVAVALTALAAASHKPPVRNIGHAVGWVFGRLIGEPIAAWYEKTYRSQALPIVEEVVASAVAPLREDVAGLRGELVRHIEEEAAAARVTTEWRAGVERSLQNLEQGQAPHLGSRASTPDEGTDR